MQSALYLKSVYSLLSSMCELKKSVTKAKELGYTSLGIVDKNVLFASASFHHICQSQGLKDIYGLEFEILLDGRKYPLFLYAKNDDGYLNLVKLSSYINDNDTPFINLEILNKYRDNCLLVVPSDNCPLTIVYEQKGDIDKCLDYQEKIYGDYYLGLMDHNIAFNINRDEHLSATYKKHNLKTVALPRIYYLEKEDYKEFEILKCIRDKKTLDKNAYFEKGRYFLNERELSELYTKEEMDNSDRFASLCNVSFSFKTSLPKYQTPNNVSSKDYLIALCKEGLKRRLKNNINDTYKKRLEYELSVILKMHFEDYFLIVYDFILYAKKRNIIVGPGRGSAAGSLVSYCLGITEIDPIKYGLLFERFLNPERISMPDIDTDFPDDKRDEVVAYVKEKYGMDHVAHIITFGTLKVKQVIRDVGRVLNYPNIEIDSLCKLVPFAYSDSLMKAYDNVPLFKQKINSEQRFRDLFNICLKLEGFPRHLSTHAAGIVFSSKKLDDVVPTVRVENDLYSTQYTAEFLEEMGLIKMDFLGLRNLGIIAEIVDDIKLNQDFNLNNIPLNDQKTFKLIKDVNLLGVFQLESSGMMNLARKMSPNSFEELSMMIALFRPGPMENIPVFLQNRAHPEKITYLVEELRPILSETYGIIVYQEQIMLIARKLAGFSLGKADLLRRAMSKKKASELEKLKPEFVSGCIKNGYKEDIALKLYELILKFANYGFNKSHSIAYGLVAYKMAYLKANFPLYFYKALLNGTIGSSSKTYDYVKECKKTNIQIEGISINNSLSLYNILDNKIIMPFTICKDVGFTSSEKIVKERNDNGPYKDYISCVYRLCNNGVDKGVILNLICAGAFDEFALSRNTMTSSLPNVLDYVHNKPIGINLIDQLDDGPVIKEVLDNKQVRAEYEKAVLGFYFSFNPLLDIKNKYHIDTLPLLVLGNNFGYQKGFGMIKRIKQHKTKNGDMMAFVDVYDDSGDMSVVIMPGLYKNNQEALRNSKYIYFEGNVDRVGSILAKKIEVLG